ncbi:hypothetical protein [Dapis sp. BLCC M229]|uniref:hypothetical protein n=1 Tax=Dapis sp. BLCC M229 TaxID=3400188 RepID=UPI003CFB0370
MLNFSNKQKYSVYWITHNSQFKINIEEYVGFSENVEKRIINHIVNAINKNQKAPLYEGIIKEGFKNFSYLIVETGLDELSAYNLDLSLRTHERIGPNRNPGGHIISLFLCYPLYIKDSFKLEKKFKKTEKYIKSKKINLYKWFYRR